MVPETVETPPKPAKICRKITSEDVEQMAQLMVKRITETGACYMLGIKPQTWFQFKGRAKNASKFEEVLTRAREAKLNATLETIDDAGNPYEVVTKSGATFMRPGDWRAKAWMAERVLAPERLGDKNSDPTQINVAIMSPEAMARIEASFKSRQQVVDVQEVKQVEDKASDQSSTV